MPILGNKLKWMVGGCALAFTLAAMADDVNMLRGKPSKEQIIQALGGDRDSDAPTRRTRGLSLGNSAAQPEQANAAPAQPEGPRALDLEIQFDFNSHRLSQDGADVLDQLGEALKSAELSSARRIVLEGHTDAKGSNAYNRVLSLRRAQAARQYLAANQRIPASKMKAIGKGSSELADPNNPEDGINRRVRIILED